MPTRPRPVTWARRGPALTAGGPSVGEVIAKTTCALEVDVVEGLFRALGVKVHENPDTARHGTGDGELAGADERDVAEAE